MHRGTQSGAGAPASAGITHMTISSDVTAAALAPRSAGQFFVSFPASPGRDAIRGRCLCRNLESACFVVPGCKVPIWASSIGPSRHALLAGGLLGHGTSGEIVAASSRLGPIELELFGGGIRPARVQRGVPGESPAAEVSLKRCDTAGPGECQVPIWASSIGPSRHALLAGGLLGQNSRVVQEGAPTKSRPRECT